MPSVQDRLCAFGWKAQEFALKGVDGKTYSLADVRGPKGTLIVFRAPRKIASSEIFCESEL
jgi:peroxiredoxin